MRKKSKILPSIKVFQCWKQVRLICLLDFTGFFDINIVVNFLLILNKIIERHFHTAIITHFIMFLLSSLRPQESTPLLLDLRDISGPVASFSSEETFSPGCSPLRPVSFGIYLQGLVDQQSELYLKFRKRGQNRWNSFE